jgi:poly-beta-1,6-N-acetyl-D-glucosamine synthase
MKSLCVIIPAKNEGTVIARTVGSVLAAGIESKDVYVIDDGSEDKTGDIARSFSVNVMRNEINKGKAASIASVMQEFDLGNRYDIITLMDADTVVNIEYYREVKNGFDSEGIAVVCGRAMSVPYNWLTSYRCLGYFWTHFVYRGAQCKMGVINVAPGCAASYRSDVFQKLDWNKDTLVEDMDVTIQVHRKKLGRIVYRPKAEVYTQDPRTLRDYTKQMNRWYTGTWQIALKYEILNSWSKIDFEFKLLMGEGLLFSLFMCTVPILALFHPIRALQILGLDMALTFLVALSCGLYDRRVDVVLATPIYTLMRFVDCGVLLYSFWRTYIRRRRADNWFSVKRY